VPSAPLRYVNEVLADPHLRERGFLTDHVTENGTVALPNSPIRFEGSKLRALEPPPKLGEHTQQVLSELCGVDAAEFETLRRDGVV
jgi:crotonobetainyl-CoA:carnitine CoA-transferase CaiB-like acyl-CoA transferase